MGSVTVIKIGGRAAAEAERILELCREIRQIEAAEAGRHLLVHGGGSELSSLMERYGYTPRFVDGIRQTSTEEMPLVDMALSGRMNSEVVRLCGKAGLNPVGLSGQDGGTVVGRPVVMADGTASRTGSVAESRGALLETLLAAGYLPVVSPVCRDEVWEGLNINADEVALAIAEALEARHLIFLSDTEGILKEGRRLPSLTPEEAEAAIGDMTISGGMIPKVRSSVRALASGVGAITIGRYEAPGDLRALAEGRKGTVLTQ